MNNNSDLINDNKLVSIILLTLTVISWGIMFPVIKNALTYIDPVNMTSLRGIGMSIVFLIILISQEGFKSVIPDKSFLKIFFFGCLGFAAFPILMYTGLKHVNPEQGAIFTALMPFLTVLLLWVLKKNKPSKMTLTTILLSFVGVFLVITKGDLSNFHFDNLKSSIMILLSVISWVIYTIGASYISSYSTIKYTSLACIWGSIFSVFISLLFDLLQYTHIPSINTILSIPYSLLYIILIAGVFAMFSWNIGIKSLGAINGILFINLVPITTLCISLLYGNKAEYITILGMMITIIAVITNNIYIRFANNKSN